MKKKAGISTAVFIGMFASNQLILQVLSGLPLLFASKTLGELSSRFFSQNRMVDKIYHLPENQYEIHTDEGLFLTTHKNNIEPTMSEDLFQQEFSKLARQEG